MVVISGDLHALATGASADYKYGNGHDGYNRRRVLLSPILRSEARFEASMPVF